MAGREPVPGPAAAPAGPGASQYVSTIEAAKILGVSTFSVQRWFDEGLLTGARMPGGHRRITAESLSRFMKSHGLLPRESASGDRRRLLLIGTDAKLLAAVRESFAGSGAVMLREATNGLDAGLALTEMRPDLVMVDLTNEDTPGPTLVARLRASPVGRSVRLVVVRPKPSAEDVRELRKAGANAVLPKPFPMRDLARAFGLA